jgi:hypothetical protein
LAFPAHTSALFRRKQEEGIGLQFAQAEQISEEEKNDEGTIMAQEKQVKFNSKGEKDCYHCGADDHWAPDCPMKEKGGEKKEKSCRLFIQVSHGAMISQFRLDGKEQVNTGGPRKIICTWILAPPTIR